MMRAIKTGAICLSAVALAVVTALYVDQRLSRACPGDEVLANDQVALTALAWLLEERSDGLGYQNAEDALGNNPNCCTMVDPSEHPATNPVYGLPGRTGFLGELLVPHYTIVEVRIVSAPAAGSRAFGGTVAVDRCGEILSGSHGG